MVFVYFCNGMVLNKSTCNFMYLRLKSSLNIQKIGLRFFAMFIHADKSWITTSFNKAWRILWIFTKSAPLILTVFLMERSHFPLYSKIILDIFRLDTVFFLTKKKKIKWHMAYDTCHMTGYMLHRPCDTWWNVNILSKCPLPSSHGLGLTLFWRYILRMT